MGNPKLEKACPQCGGKISWKVVRNGLGAPLSNGLCRKCNVLFRGRECPEITRGKALERSGKTAKIHCMDKRITSLPCDVQIGILRQRQHPRGDEVYFPFCKKCNEGQMQYQRKDGHYKCSVCGTINKD